MPKKKHRKTLWASRYENVVNLRLDDDNVRLDLHGQSASQDALIHDLFINQDAFEILHDIARDGFFPHELPIVVGPKGSAVVLEGNRRIAALKAAINPALVPAYSKRIDNLLKDSPYLPLTSIEEKVAPNRIAAQPVIAAIHTKLSRKPWATLRQAYFYFAQIESGSKTIDELKREYPAVDIARFVRMWEMHKVARSISYDREDEARKVANQQKFPITTLERIYSIEDFRRAFHFDFTPSGELEIRADVTSFKTAFRQVILDILSGDVSSRNLNKSSEINAHLARWKKPKLAKGKKLSRTSAFKPISIPPKVKKTGGVAPKDMVCTLPYPALKRVLYELQKINYREFPNATHDVLRSFLECALKAYFDHKKVTVPKKGRWIYLNDVLTCARDHFKTEKPGLVQPLNVIINNQSYLHSQDYLNALNHNHSVFSTGDTVKNAWDQMEPVLRYALDPK